MPFTGATKRVSSRLGSPEMTLRKATGWIRVALRSVGEFSWRVPLLPVLHCLGTSRGL